jgi:hypothetical protein
MSSFDVVMQAYPITPGSEWVVTDVNGETILMGSERVPTPALVEVSRINRMGETYVVPYLLEEDLTEEFEQVGTWRIYRFRPPFRWVKLEDEDLFVVGLPEDRLGFWPEIVEALVSGVPDDELVRFTVSVWSRAKHVARPVSIQLNDALETTIGAGETEWLVWEPMRERAPRSSRPTPRRKA